MYHYDLIAISESMLDKSIPNDDIFIHGFSRNIFWSDHPGESKIGGACLYYRENLPITQRLDLQVLDEMIVSEIKIGRKKVFFVVIYRSPNQNKDELESFIEKLQSAIDFMKNERPHCVCVTGDLNCRSQHWRAGDIDSPQGTALDKLIESNNFCQLIDQPTNIETTSKSGVDLNFTDQPLLFVDYRVHPSLDNCCHHQIVYGKLNTEIVGIV